MSERNERWEPEGVRFEARPLDGGDLDLGDWFAFVLIVLVAAVLGAPLFLAVWIFDATLAVWTFGGAVGVSVVAGLGLQLWSDARSRRALPIRIGRNYVRIGSQHFPSVELESAHWARQSLVLRFRDGTAWVSRPLELDDPHRVVGWIRAGIVTQEELFEEVEAAQQVLRALDELRVEAAEFR